MHTEDQKLMLSCRVANIRSKQILQPNVEMLLAMEADCSDGKGRELKLQVSVQIWPFKCC